MEQHAEILAHRIGRAVVTKVPELSLTFPAAKLLQGWKAGGENGGDASLTLNVHSWLVRIDGLTVLVDAGVGNGKTRAVAAFDGLDTPWLTRLAAAGARPEDVTHVLLTHLHTDHVGWNTVPGQDGWVPTFPNAVTVMPRLGYEFFMSPTGRARRPNHDMFVDSVVPVVEAGRVVFVGPHEAEPLPGFTFLPTPGHSLDHSSILLRSDGREALFAGDVLHHPDQVARPDLCSTFCERPDEARRSRLRMLDLAGDRALTWFSSHCADTSAGRIRRTVDGFAWSFV
ncbi:MBL fold metallo-hydrolase [Lichenibacterium minor]|uniref:MBL fold metallo-hydrolase n=1 Tax=Lichenibacterium minor TaxID=2316528 RepID=A0A4Q2TYF8_9HYPH|nr:MBL fold metallo-hydrolase [Lichenibacterium minor]RYC28750.1 MBL fold metallo-hydrolase [Lichenibacterium minor]